MANRPGMPRRGPSIETAEGIGAYVTEVMERLAKERDRYKEALHHVAAVEWGVDPKLLAQEMIRDIEDYRKEDHDDG